MKLQLVAGVCPACGLRLLAVTRTGSLVCCAEDCPRPSAAAEILASIDVDHVVELYPDDFTLRHPLLERLDDALFACRLHDAIAASDGRPAPPGRYHVRTDEHGELYFVATITSPTEGAPS